MQSGDFNVDKKAFTAIWNGDTSARDTYVDFKDNFAADCGGERIFIEISCDSNYSACVNGKPVAFSACSDYPFAREYDKIDVTENIAKKTTNCSSRCGITAKTVRCI